MPVQECQEEGRPGYRWGQEGKCYTFDPSSDESRERARSQAEEQGRAIEAGRRGVRFRGRPEGWR